MRVSTNATTITELRDDIVADLRNRAETLTASIKLQKTKAAKAACYIAAQALSVAADDYAQMILPDSQK